MFKKIPRSLFIAVMFLISVGSVNNVYAYATKENFFSNNKFACSETTGATTPVPPIVKPPVKNRPVKKLPIEKPPVSKKSDDSHNDDNNK